VETQKQCRKDKKNLSPSITAASAKTASKQSELRAAQKQIQKI
jgi:hypothetical protein